MKPVMIDSGSRWDPCALQSVPCITVYSQARATSARLQASVCPCARMRPPCDRDVSGMRLSMWPLLTRQGNQRDHLPGNPVVRVPYVFVFRVWGLPLLMSPQMSFQMPQSSLQGHG